MKKHRYFNLLAIAFIVFTFIKCAEKKTTVTVVEPPIPGIDPEYVNFNIDNTTADTLTLPSGTKLFIPAQAFVDSLGNPVVKDITIKYREFNNGVDIFRAGITMEYESMGRKSYFQTAGMFEIRGFHGNQTLFMDDKPIQISYASFQEEENYNFFSFNENTGKWEFINLPKSEPNPEKNNLRKVIKQLYAKKEKLSFGNNYFVINYDAIVDVNYENDYRKIYDWYREGRPDIKEVTRKAEDYDIFWSGLNSFQGISYYGNYNPAALMIWKRISGDKLPDAIKAPYYNTKFELISGNRYKLTIYDGTYAKYADDQNYSENEISHTTVEAVMPMKKLFKYPPSHWRKNFDELMAKIKEEEMQLAKMAEVYRSIDIMNFGFHNFDRLMKFEQNLEIIANFKLDNYDGEIDKICCIPGDNQSKIDINLSFDDTKIWLDPEDKNYRIFTVLPDFRIAVFPIDEYRSIDFDSLRNAPNKEYTFNLEPNETPVDSVEQLLNLLGFSN
ncbi:hypothetical protein ACFLQ9_00395 [Bacteroidota bacterium]